MRRFRLRLLLLGGALAAALLTVAAGGTTFPGSAITVNECCGPPPTAAQTGNPTQAATYPSPITVPASLGGNITDVKVTLTLDFNFPQDLDILLESAHHEKVLLMSDAGGGSDTFLPDTLTFQTGATPIPDSPAGELTSGIYSPANYASDCDNQTDPLNEGFPAPAPTAPGGGYSTALSTFNGVSAIGTWNLYVIDDCNGIGPANSITSWSLNIMTDATTSVQVRTFTARRSGSGIALTWRTASENGVLGFNVYRFQGTQKGKVNKSLVPAKGRGQQTGASYRLLDTRGRTGMTYTYRLQAVGLDGKRSWKGFAKLPSN